MVLSRFRHETAKPIPARRYWVGDDTTANAGPRHLVTFKETVWIDIRPVSISDVQKCILQGGLIPRRKFPTTESRAGVAACSVDSLFRTVLETTIRVFSAPNRPLGLLGNYPACGLLWGEAVQVCSFFGARLPTEAEWEIGLGWHGGAGGLEFRNATSCSAIVSRVGCDCYAGIVQEWTGSEWTSRYWADININHPKALAPGSQVSVRGCLATANVASQYARLAFDMDDVSVPRIFRRAWDGVPDSEPQYSS
ncbi:MAG TPA: hypothetical protein DDZ51_22705 [Planctomycetaceae bacterium]|nr:hypothetical protein [Planctomycetaceae bacterium]